MRPDSVRLDSEDSEDCVESVSGQLPPEGKWNTKNSSARSHESMRSSYGIAMRSGSQKLLSKAGDVEATKPGIELLA